MVKPVYRTDQVGSLLRPPRLLEARDKYKAGHLSAKDLRHEEDICIVDALAKQKSCGVDVFTDGEARRDSWQTGFAHAAEGFDPEYPILDLRRPDGSVKQVETHTQTINGKIRRKGRIAQDEALFLKRHAPGPFKITMPSPAFIARIGYRAGVSDVVYPVFQDLLDDVTQVVKDEMKALADDGVSYIQLDEGFVYYVSSLMRSFSPSADLERALEVDIMAENICYDSVRDRITVAMHVCRGSRVSWMHEESGYDWLAERLFNSLHVDRFLLEYDLDYGFASLRFLPKGKIAVLGLISSKEPRVETVDELRRRIDQAAKFCPLERLALTTQCGFQSAADRDAAHLDIDTQWRKIEVMAETARKVWN